MPCMDADHTLREEGLRNFGVVARKTALARGITDRMIEVRLRKGALIRRFPATFVLPSFPRTFEQDCAAALAWLGDDSSLHGASTAVLLGLDGARGPTVHVWTPRHVRPRDNVVPHKVAAGQVPVRRWYQGLAIVAAEQIFMDVAAASSPSAAELVLDALLQRRLTTLERVSARIQDWHGHGSSAARRILEERKRFPERLDSWLEKRFARLVRDHGLPMPLTQQRFLDGERCVARVDFLYPWADLVIEVDGYGSHGARQAWQRDLRRNNELVLRRLRTLRYSSDDIKHRAALMAEEIRAALAAAERPA